MSIIQTNKPNFFGNGAEPLKSGYIWVGEPNKSPIDYPLTVTFTDSAGASFPATQPLRTNNQGQIQWNGKAIIASVNQDYSMLIQDSTQTDINNGYTTSIAADSSQASFSGVRNYGLTLDAAKAINAAPGDTIGNIGRTLVDDGEGFDWLVVSPTGGMADNLDLIDMTNGLQARRLIKEEQPIAGYVQCGKEYYCDDSVILTKYDFAADLAADDVFESFGPTASGADNPFADMDILPPNTKWLIIAIQVRTLSDPASMIVSMRKTGTAITKFDCIKLRAAIDPVAAAGGTIFTSEFKIAVDGDLRFDILKSGITSGSGLTFIQLRGFGVK
jgi:hypothetical protein